MSAVLSPILDGGAPGGGAVVIQQGVDGNPERRCECGDHDGLRPGFP
jgi:hypothetical protein